MVIGHQFFSFNFCMEIHDRAPHLSLGAIKYTMIPNGKMCLEFNKATKGDPTSGELVGSTSF